MVRLLRNFGAPLMEHEIERQDKIDWAVVVENIQEIVGPFRFEFGYGTLPHSVTLDAA